MPVENVLIVLVVSVAFAAVISLVCSLVWAGILWVVLGGPIVRSINALHADVEQIRGKLPNLTRLTRKLRSQMPSKATETTEADLTLEAQRHLRGES